MSAATPVVLEPNGSSGNLSSRIRLSGLADMHTAQAIGPRAIAYRLKKSQDATNTTENAITIDASGCAPWALTAAE